MRVGEEQQELCATQGQGRYSRHQDSRRKSKALLVDEMKGTSSPGELARE